MIKEIEPAAPPRPYVGDLRTLSDAELASYIEAYSDHDGPRAMQEAVMRLLRRAAGWRVGS